MLRIDKKKCFLKSSGDADIEVVRDTYERAIANIPLVAEKSFWRRYIYLWINYALFEELEAEDYEKTRQVYDSCLKLIPHRNFTFAKIWLLYAHFEVRQKNLQMARKILGTAIGKCPKVNNVQEFRFMVLLTRLKNQIKFSLRNELIVNSSVYCRTSCFAGTLI